jgi:hypothetical protein
MGVLFKQYVYLRNCKEKLNVTKTAGDRVICCQYCNFTCESYNMYHSPFRQFTVLKGTIIFFITINTGTGHVCTVYIVYVYIYMYMYSICIHVYVSVYVHFL